MEVVDCGFGPNAQIEAFARLTAGKIDAIISIHLGNEAVADAHRLVHAAAKRRDISGRGLPMRSR